MFTGMLISTNASRTGIVEKVLNSIYIIVLCLIPDKIGRRMQLEEISLPDAEVERCAGGIAVLVATSTAGATCFFTSYQPELPDWLKTDF